MNEVMKAVGAIGKEQFNSHQKFKFRGIDQFVNALYPALCDHGVFMVPECVSEHHEIREVTRSNGNSGVDNVVHLMMKYTFYAEDGSSVTIGPIPAEGLDSGDKSTTKALSFALKYALIQTFSIPTEDMSEPDSDSPELGKAKQAQPQQQQPKPTQPTPTQKQPEPPKQEAAKPPTTNVAPKKPEPPKQQEQAKPKPSFRKPSDVKKEAAPQKAKNDEEDWGEDA